VPSVLVVAPWGERRGGAENFLWTWLCHAGRDAVEPSVVLLQDGPFADDLRSIGVRTVVIPSGRLRQPRAVARTVSALAALLRRERPALLLDWCAKTHLYGAAAAALSGMADRVVWWQHGVPSGEMLDRAATRLPARAVGCSSHAGAMAQALLNPRRRTFVVHPGVEQALPPSPPEVAAMRRRLGMPAEVPVVAMVARLQPWKGQDRMLRALALLRARGVAVHGLVVGGEAFGFSAGYGEELRRLARSLGIDHSVTFTGHVDDPAELAVLTAVADVALNLSDAEPFGISLVEAMGLGRAVLAVDSAGPRVIVEAGVSGVLVESGEPHRVAAALEHLLGDAALRQRLGVAAQRRAAERFSAPCMAAEMSTRLLELCA
jgi:glycosyltransferase involved in cell wall biosynthesis